MARRSGVATLRFERAAAIVCPRSYSSLRQLDRELHSFQLVEASYDRATVERVRISVDPHYDQCMEPNNEPHKSQDAEAAAEPTYDDLLAEVRSWREASARWRKIEERLSRLRDRYDALVVAARSTHHGDHDYDPDLPARTDCYLCAAIEGRFQPRWMDEARDWVQDPLVKDICDHIWEDGEGGRTCILCGKFDRRYDLD
jgi:hypothetical protein